MRKIKKTNMKKIKKIRVIETRIKSSQKHNIKIKYRIIKTRVKIRK
jgi:hypothetical protein